MFEHEDQLLVYMTQAIDNLYTKTVEYTPSIDDFEDLVVNVDVRGDAAAKMKLSLADSHTITFEALKDEEYLAKKAAAEKKSPKKQKRAGVFDIAADAEDQDKGMGMSIIAQSSE